FERAELGVDAAAGSTYQVAGGEAAAAGAVADQVMARGGEIAVEGRSDVENGSTVGGEGGVPHVQVAVDSASVAGGGAGHGAVADRQRDGGVVGDAAAKAQPIGRVARNRAVADRHWSGIVDSTAIAGPVVRDRTIGDLHTRLAPVKDATAFAGEWEAKSVARDSAVGDGHRPVVVVEDAATKSQRLNASSQGKVARDHAVTNRERAIVVDAATAVAFVKVAADGAVAHCQRPRVADTATTKIMKRITIGDGQPGDANRRAIIRHRENAVGVAGIPSHGQEVGPRPVDADAVGQVGQ